MSRQLPLACLLILAAIWLVGCGSESQATAAVSAANTAVPGANATLTAASGAVNTALPGAAATITAATGAANTAVPGALATASAGPGAVATAIASARPSGLPSGVPSLPSGLPSGLPSVPGGVRPTVGGSGPGGSNLPAGFPLPQGAQVFSSVENGGQIIVVLTVASAKDAYDYYKGALPGAGYQVTDPGAVNVPGGAFVSTLNVTGSQYDGNLAFTSVGPNGQTVTITLRKK